MNISQWYMPLVPGSIYRMFSRSLDEGYRSLPLFRIYLGRVEREAWDATGIPFKRRQEIASESRKRLENTPSVEEWVARTNSFKPMIAFLEGVTLLLPLLEWREASRTGDYTWAAIITCAAIGTRYFFYNRDKKFAQFASDSFRKLEEELGSGENLAVLQENKRVKKPST